MKILYAASEAAPYAKTGGLANVAGVLPKALAELGHDVRVAMPLYASIDRTKYGIDPLVPEMCADIGGERQIGRVFQGRLPQSRVPVYFIGHEGYFGRPGLYQEAGQDFEDNADRFGFFSLTALWTLQSLHWRPDAIVCNDWQTALIPVFLKNLDLMRRDLFYTGIKTLLATHNLAFQGLADRSFLGRVGLPYNLYTIQGLEFYGKVNILKGGILYADKICTVSPRYAKEIQTKEYGCGLEGVLAGRSGDLVGILNGIDTHAWNPEHDDLIPETFSARDLAGKARCKAALQEKCGLPVKPKIPLIGSISRLTDQKGFDLVAEAAKQIMKLGAQFVLLGTGDEIYHEFFAQMQEDHPRQTSVHLAFNNRLAHEIEAGSDMFLMPSRFEPCGLNQMYSLRYGTIPIVRRTGGLADSIENWTPAAHRNGKGTGFVFEKYTPAAMMAAVKRAVTLCHKEPKTWSALQLRAMAQDVSWSRSAKEYEDLLKKMLK